MAAILDLATKEDIFQAGFNTLCKVFGAKNTIPASSTVLPKADLMRLVRC